MKNIEFHYIAIYPYHHHRHHPLNHHHHQFICAFCADCILSSGKQVASENSLLHFIIYHHSRFCIEILFSLEQFSLLLHCVSLFHFLHFITVHFSATKATEMKPFPDKRHQTWSYVHYSSHSSLSSSKPSSFPKFRKNKTNPLSLSQYLSVRAQHFYYCILYKYSIQKQQCQILFHFTQFSKIKRLYAFLALAKISFFKADSHLNRAGLLEKMRMMRLSFHKKPPKNHFLGFLSSSLSFYFDFFCPSPN